MIRLRPADPEDDMVFWKIRNEGLAEADQIPWKEHEAWWQGVWEHRFLAYDGPATVGTLRLSKEGEVHIVVAKCERGKGLGTQMLVSIQRVAKDLGFEKLYARVFPENLASQAAFMGAKWHPVQFTVNL